MLIKQLYFSHTGLATKGNSCMKIFPPSVLKLVSWAKLTASPFPPLCRWFAQWALGSMLEHNKQEWLKLASDKQEKVHHSQKILSPSWEVSSPWKKGMWSFRWWGRLKSAEKGRPEILSFFGGEGWGEMRNEVFFPQLGYFWLQIKPSTTWLFLWSDAEMGELTPL